ncbi:hypothetical protein DSO57_1020534 [Entomophthora muscae]|uniref:Uncharacterized protein n=1 Tax=Entomophthora muscae TaxID=34485 RepID=A0ACC2RUN7_9FUNG|nr:hypothetical protein DSO57_1020534 [Entomophthora muscae]
MKSIIIILLAVVATQASIGSNPTTISNHGTASQKEQFVTIPSKDDNCSGKLCCVKETQGMKKTLLRVDHGGSVDDALSGINLWKSLVGGDGLKCYGINIDVKNYQTDNTLNYIWSVLIIGQQRVAITIPKEVYTQLKRSDK